MALNFFLNYQKEILEIILLSLSIITHVLDANQKLLARILWFPHLLLNIYIFTKKQLYGKVLYSIVTIFINFYAYIKWKGTKVNPPVQVSKTNTTILFLSIVASLIVAAIWSLNMATKIRIPIVAIYFDTLYTILGFMEKWLMSNKKLERWIFASIRYAFFMISCLKTNSPILVIQHILLIFIAMYGQYKWYKSYKAQQTTT